MMERNVFDKIVKKYPEAIIHITGGEPSIVPWLYKYMDSNPGTFHLNTNLYIPAPIHVKRLKVSLDTNNAEYFNSLVGKKDAFDTVLGNIRKACLYTTTSVTCVLTKENYKQTPEFMRFCREQLPDLYAVFFSVYKGTDERFVFQPENVYDFFNHTRLALEKEMDPESLALLQETIDEKYRIIQGERFPENVIGKKCYLSLSERIYDYDGKEYHCSHLYRDNIKTNDCLVQEACRYGCNRRLVKFNEEVEELLKGGIERNSGYSEK